MQQYIANPMRKKAIKNFRSSLNQMTTAHHQSMHAHVKITLNHKVNLMLSIASPYDEYKFIPNSRLHCINAMLAITFLGKDKGWLKELGTILARLYIKQHMPNIRRSSPKGLTEISWPFFYLIKHVENKELLPKSTVLKLKCLIIIGHLYI